MRDQTQEMMMMMMMMMMMTTTTLKAAFDVGWLAGRHMALRWFLLSPHFTEEETESLDHIVSKW